MSNKQWHFHCGEFMKLTLKTLICFRKSIKQPGLTLLPYLKENYSYWFFFPTAYPTEH